MDGHKEKDRRGAKHIIPPERRGGFKKWMAYENNNSQWDTWVLFLWIRGTIQRPKIEIQINPRKLSAAFYGQFKCEIGS